MLPDHVIAIASMAILTITALTAIASLIYIAVSVKSYSKDGPDGKSMEPTKCPHKKDCPNCGIKPK